jgi:hypothetical protein
VGDLASEFVTSTVKFGHQRLSKLIDMDAATLLAILVPELEPTPAVAAADQALTRTEANLVKLEAALVTAAQDLGQVRGAVRALGATVESAVEGCTAVARALPGNAPTPETMIERLAQRLLGDPEPPAGGILHQLGLAPDAGTWTATGSALHYVLMRPDPVDPVTGVTLSGLALSLDLTWTEPRVTTCVTADVELGLDAGALADMLPAGLGARSRFTVTVDSEDGVEVGEGRRHVYLPATPTLPVIEISALGLGLTDDDLCLEVTSQVGLSLTAGLAVVVDGAGFAVAMDPASDTPLAITRLEPSGIRLTVDAGLVRGGGYLAQRAGSFAGTLELTIGPTSAKAVVLLSTDPFSLVVLFFAEFAAAVQLSFGFTLNGIGGLLAVDRSVSKQALQARIWDGSADALLFPERRENVSKELLETVFPPTPGTLAIGPAFKLGWGTPISLMVAKLGVVLVLPDPSIVILGRVRVAIPGPALPLVDLNVRVFGEVTPDHVLVIAGLEGSKMAGFTLSGEFGVLVGYGRSPVFALSAGGFHPRFTPPGALARLRRITVDMSPPVLLTLRAEAYVALTSNALMVGARVEAGIDFRVASAHGQLSFDALVLWNPLHFEIDLRALVEVEVGGLSVMGVDVALHLEGPGTWRAHGTASIDVIFLPTLRLEVGPLTWGDQRVEQPLVVSPAALVLEQMRDRAAWQPRLPPDAARMVSFGDRASPDARALLAHPLGDFEVRQKLLPLDTELQHHGGYPVAEHRVTLGRPRVGETESEHAEPLQDLFGTGLFRRLTDDAKLSGAATYERFQSGVHLSASPVSFGAVVGADLEWRTVYPGQDVAAAGPQPFDLGAGQVPHLLMTSAAGRRRARGDANPYAWVGAVR